MLSFHSLGDVQETLNEMGGLQVDSATVPTIPSTLKRRRTIYMRGRVAAIASLYLQPHAVNKRFLKPGVGLHVRDVQGFHNLACRRVVSRVEDARSNTVRFSIACSTGHPGATCNNRPGATGAPSAAEAGPSSATKLDTPAVET
eukprot:CAMPEP_0172906350 /NCGR_PEP_ID=MMETSP1075-20121228/176655_1 /TAXON_ID=2916 /ORGANISM="Ceratium fusus, Strain PA161109" /LENGTH=143 /DNA_ID=CAMNT_0013763755 /DNA_START=43 /DNA_END=475 /DNA_ORIENTATION=-